MRLKKQILENLSAIVGADGVLTRREDLVPYSFDGTASWRQLPGCVALAKSTEKIADILKLANRFKVPVVTRGSERV